MSTVGIKELKDRLTQYIRQVRQGEEVVITDRGKPVAVMQSIRSGHEFATLEAKLWRLAAQGRLTPPTTKLLKKVRRVKVRGGPLSRAILEDRR